MSSETYQSEASQEKYLLQSLSIVHRIVKGKLGFAYRDSVDDLNQQIFLKLWRWKKARSDKELSEVEWEKLASVTAHNEIIDFFTSSQRRMILFSQIDENTEELHLSVISSVNNQEPQPGSPSIETRSLLLLIWKSAQNLTLRQKYAFMLNNPDFIVDFIAAECCSMKELAAYFDITIKELSAIAGNNSLPDKEIAEILEKKLNKKVSPKSVWEARGKAKAKIAKRLAELLNNVGTSDERKT